MIVLMGGLETFQGFHVRVRVVVRIWDNLDVDGQVGLIGLQDFELHMISEIVVVVLVIDSHRCQDCCGSNQCC